MELADFFILLIWTLKVKLARISKPRRKQKLNPAYVIEKGENDASVRIDIVKCLFIYDSNFIRKSCSCAIYSPNGSCYKENKSDRN
jgi:hypothetical protein